MSSRKPPATGAEARAEALATMSEQEFLADIIDLAHVLGWTVAHFRPGMISRTGKDGKPIWVTPVQADGAGFPDLVLVRERVIYAEVKAKGGKFTEAQEKWMYALAAAGAEYYTWRPPNWEEVYSVLQTN